MAQVLSSRPAGVTLRKAAFSRTGASAGPRTAPGTPAADVLRRPQSIARRITLASSSALCASLETATSAAAPRARALRRSWASRRAWARERPRVTRPSGAIQTSSRRDAEDLRVGSIELDSLRFVLTRSSPVRVFTAETLRLVAHPSRGEHARAHRGGRSKCAAPRPRASPGRCGSAARKLRGRRPWLARVRLFREEEPELWRLASRKLRPERRTSERVRSHWRSRQRSPRWQCNCRGHSSTATTTPSINAPSSMNSRRSFAERDLVFLDDCDEFWPEIRDTFMTPATGWKSDGTDGRIGGWEGPRSEDVPNCVRRP